jgi:heme exporter protein D
VIELGRHAGFILIAYLGVGIGVAVAVLMVTLGGLRAERRLKDLEARGIRRRSEGAS